MPDHKIINKDFIKDVLCGKKMLMRQDEIKTISVPFYDELSVKKLWPQFSKEPDFIKYFPDKYPVGKGPPRQYFFDLLNTLYPEYLQ